MTEEDALLLFTERAAAARGAGSGRPRGSEAAAAELCRRLDGIPLALELAAGRLGALSVEQLLRRLDDRFRLLTGGGRGALPRHQTLRHDHRLEPRAVHGGASGCCGRGSRCSPGTFDLEAVEYICVGPDLPPGGGARRPRRADRPVARGARGRRGRRPLPPARHGPRVRRRVAGGDGRRGAAAPAPPRLVPGARHLVRAGLVQPAPGRGRDAGGGRTAQSAGRDGVLAQSRARTRTWPSTWRARSGSAGSAAGGSPRGGTGWRRSWRPRASTAVHASRRCGCSAMWRCSRATRWRRSPRCRSAARRPSCAATGWRRRTPCTARGVWPWSPTTCRAPRSCCGRARRIRGGRRAQQQRADGAGRAGDGGGLPGPPRRGRVGVRAGREVCDDHGERWAPRLCAVRPGYAAWAAATGDRARALLRETLTVNHAFHDLVGTVLALEMLALVAVDAGDPVEAAVLQGAAERIWPLGGPAPVRFGATSTPRTCCARSATEGAAGRRGLRGAPGAGAPGSTPDAAVARALGTRPRRLIGVRELTPAQRSAGGAREAAASAAVSRPRGGPPRDGRSAAASGEGAGHSGSPPPPAPCGAGGRRAEALRLRVLRRDQRA